ncbi:hypothetical protein HHK36_012485 [Tetracentron sinense]|uniref:Serine aminopeptidase S33 domain-containing protein n=1 Tax=Tetracentron sinense TaxID=13715 RepID=A0A834ZAG9_TETSI|nr:hypothetical protein HHK36_012485 [Tetracentron sinense]
MVLTATSLSASRISISPCFPVVCECKSRGGLRVRSLASGDSTALSSGSVGKNKASFVGGKEGIDGGNGWLGSEVEERRTGNDEGSDGLELLWDDGYGTDNVKDYFDIAREMIKPDGGPPRWFSPIACGRPIKDSPLLLFLPGIDGVGLGLILHHKSLGKVFEVRCMHIPVYDRTSFDGLVEFVENTLRLEHALSPNKPIYMVGDSLGGCLALAVAARNPTIDLILILSNPATSFDKSQLQLVLPILEALSEGLHIAVPYLLSFIMGDPIKMAMVNVERGLPPAQILEQLSRNLTSWLPHLSGLADIIPKETLLWKLKLLKSAAAYANSRLHAVKAEVLVLASGKDNMLPSGDEAQRLLTSLQNCRVRYFKDNGHTLLLVGEDHFFFIISCSWVFKELSFLDTSFQILMKLEDGVFLLSVIKGTNMYRRSRRHNFLSDFLLPSMTEFKFAFDQQTGLYRLATSLVMFSTLGDGKIVKGLSGVPNEGPILLVGYHMLLGFEVVPLVEEFLREKKIMLRCLAHPEFFSQRVEKYTQEYSLFDLVSVFGAVPVTGSNLFKLLSTKSHVLLYPGGAREALHRKGEEYKLFWPDQPEFVRMAARCGATIVPFGVVGEDDIAEMVLDFNDLMRIPLVRDSIKEFNKDLIKIRSEASEEVSKQEMFCPVILPKIPGRFYCLFGKPIRTKGRTDLLEDRQNANVLYLEIKSEIESMMAYLRKKRQEDPYRGIIQRTVYRAISAPVHQVPTFDP